MLPLQRPRSWVWSAIPQPAKHRGKEQTALGDPLLLQEKRQEWKDQIFTYVFIKSKNKSFLVEGITSERDCQRSGSFLAAWSVLDISEEKGKNLQTPPHPPTLCKKKKVKFLRQTWFLRAEIKIEISLSEIVTDADFQPSLCVCLIHAHVCFHLVSREFEFLMETTNFAGQVSVLKKNGEQWF